MANRFRINDVSQWDHSPAIWRAVMMRLHCVYRVALLESMGSWNTSVSLSGSDAFGKSITVSHRGEQA